MLDKNNEDLSSEKEIENNKNQTVKNENLDADTSKKEDDKIVVDSSLIEEIKEQEVFDQIETEMVEVKAEEPVEIETQLNPLEIQKEEVEIEQEVSRITEDKINDIDSIKVEVATDKPALPEEVLEKHGENNDEIEEEITSKIEKQKHEIPTLDFAVLTLEELTDTLANFIQNHSINDIKNQFESIKSNFNLKFNELLAEKKEEFIKGGGNEIDFQFTSPIKSKFNALVKDYKRKRQAVYKDIEREQKQNLERRLELIDELKSLIDNADASTMYKNFRAMQDEWRKVGQIPHTIYNDVWQTYHHHVERFYDLLHLNNDFRDLDFKHNLEEKTKLAEKAEELAEDKDVNHSFKELQILHRMWKEDIGPVAREMREDIWNRFSEATKKIHNKRHEFLSQLEEKFDKNVDLKLSLIDKIKAINISNITSHKLWQEKISTLEELREEFFAIGRVPKAKSEEVWQLFKEATKKFNREKNIFYKSLKENQTDNLTKKLALVEQAESLKDSDDWDAVSEVLKKIQSDWKKIGHVPRKDSDKIWKRFKDACNHFFDRLHHKMDDANKGQEEVFTKKKDLLEQFKDQVNQEDILTLDLVNSYVNDWKSLGAVPVKMRHIDSKFNKVLDVAYKKLNIDKDEVNLLKFKNVIDIYVGQNDVRKLDNEQLFVRRKVDEITKEIKQLENNISFFSNATRDNPLVKNVYDTIDRHNKDLEFWQNKLSYLTSLNY